MMDFNQLAHKVVQATIDATEPSEQSPAPKIAEKEPHVPAEGDETDAQQEQR